MITELLIRMPQCSNRDICIMHFFKINMKDNWEPLVDEVLPWEYRYVFVLCPFYVVKLIVGNRYRYDITTKMLSSQWNNNNQHSLNIIVIWYLLEIITRQGFLFHALAWVGVLVEITASKIWIKCNFQFKNAFEKSSLKCWSFHSMLSVKKNYARLVVTFPISSFYTTSNKQTFFILCHSLSKRFSVHTSIDK